MHPPTLPLYTKVRLSPFRMIARQYSPWIKSARVRELFGHS